MAENEFTKGDTLPPGIEADPLARAFVYRMRRDALMIVTNLHRGRELPCMDVMKQQLVFVQDQLCRAALADPRLPSRAKEALMAFHGLTVHENIADRRGSRRRFDAVRESAPRSSSHDTPRT